MTILANGRLARVTTWYNAVCFWFEPLLSQRGGITRTKCVRDTMGQEINTEHLPGRGPQLTSLFRVKGSFGSVLHCHLLCIMQVMGTVLFTTKVCTVDIGHCPPVSCMHF